MAVRAVVFDFGGVIVTSPFEAFDRYERARGLPEGFIRRLNATHPDTNAWARLERSEVDLPTFVGLFEAEARAAGHEIDGAAVMGLLGGALRPEMVEALRRCHERLKTAMLTNNFVLTRRAGPEGDVGAGGTRADAGRHGVPGDADARGARGGTGPERANPMTAVLEHFDVVLESSRAGVRKPDPAIYRMVCAELGVEPAEAVFLDDLGINLKPARALGMTTIKVVDPAAAIVELEKVVGFPLG